MKNFLKQHWIIIVAVLALILVVGFFGIGKVWDGQFKPTPVTQETLDRLASTLKEPYSVKEGQIYYQGTLMEDVDVGTFEPFPEPNQSFSRDKNHVYYVLDKVEGGDPATFEFFYPEYWGLARDKNRVYIQQNAIEGADPATFAVIKGTGYFKDKSHVFFGTEQIPGADPATFEPVIVVEWNSSEKKLATTTRPYSKDKSAVYFVPVYEDESKIEAIPDSDPATFIGVKDARGVDLYFKDKNQIYDTEMGVLTGSDPATFQLLTSEYSKDARFVFYQNEMVPLADPATFRVIGDGFGQDKNGLYENGKNIFDLSKGPSPFEVAAGRMRGLLPKDDTAIDSIVATYYELTSGYGGTYEGKDVFFLDNKKEADEFFEPFYKDLKKTETFNLQKFTAFRFAFIAPGSPASTHELSWPTGNDSGGRLAGKKLLDENTMLVYGAYNWEAYRGPSAYECKETGTNIDKFIFKKINGEWYLSEIEEYIDSWVTTNEGKTAEECKEINQDKIEKYRNP